MSTTTLLMMALIVLQGYLQRALRPQLLRAFDLLRKAPHEPGESSRPTGWECPSLGRDFFATGRAANGCGTRLRLVKERRHISHVLRQLRTSTRSRLSTDGLRGAAGGHPPRVRGRDSLVEASLLWQSRAGHAGRRLPPCVRELARLCWKPPSSGQCVKLLRGAHVGPGGHFRTWRALAQRSLRLGGH